MLIRPSALGDVCRTTPVLVSLKRAWPEAAIDWLVQDTFIDAIRAHPALHRAVAFPRSALGSRRLLSMGYLPTLWRFLRELRGPGYDLVVDCQGLSRSGLFARLTGAPVRVGHRDASEMGWLGCNVRVRTDAIHTVDRMLALVEALPGGGAPVVPDARLYTPQECLDVFRRAPFTSLERGRYVVVGPTTRWPGKLWPPERHVDVIRTLLAEGTTKRVVLVGAGAERGQVEGLLAYAADEPRVIDGLGATSIGELMALIEGAALVIAGDSAAIHMAVGFGRPLVALYGPTRVDRVGPWRREADVIQVCAPDHTLSHKNEAEGRRAMEMISVERVVEAAMERLGRESAAPAQATHQ